MRNSCLLPLIKHNYRYIDYVAISAFVERWQPETNTFHLPFGEMMITLDDVSSILGVSVLGSCFNASWGRKEIAANNAMKLTIEELGVSEAEVVEEYDKAFSVRLDWIKKRCERHATNASTEEELYQCARGYLLYVLGCVVFPDKTKTRVSCYYLGALKDLSKVGEIAWGVAILAYTYRQLGLSSRAGVKSITGCLTLVVVHFHHLTFR